MKTVKQMLYEYGYCDETILKKNQQLNNLIMCQEETRNTLKAQSIDDMPKGGGISDLTYNAVIKIVDEYQVEIERLVKNIQEQLDNRKIIEKALKELTITERQIIQQRYFEQNRWSRISRCMNYTKRQCFRIHDEAIKKIEDIINMSLNVTK